MRPTSRMREAIARSVSTFAPGVADAPAAGVVAREKFEAVDTAGSRASLARPGLSGGRLIHVARMIEVKCHPFDGP